MKPQKLPFEPGAIDAVANAAKAAKAAQIARMLAAKNPLEAYWAGSVVASLEAHYEAGAVVVVGAK